MKWSHFSIFFLLLLFTIFFVAFHKKTSGSLLHLHNNHFSFVNALLKLKFQTLLPRNCRLLPILPILTYRDSSRLVLCLDTRRHELLHYLLWFTKLSTCFVVCCAQQHEYTTSASLHISAVSLLRLLHSCHKTRGILLDSLCCGGLRE